MNARLAPAPAKGIDSLSPFAAELPAVFDFDRDDVTAASASPNIRRSP
jgi:hypothetical protein